ncbi:MAG: response regulator [Pyrinomonadaceae bacterium]
MPPKMMIVDKEPADLRRLERLFGFTYQVLCATSGEEALGLLAQHDVALLITDQRLPCMTGTELLERGGALHPHMVRIILTAHADAVASANDSSEMASLDALAPDRLALLRLTRADLARVHEMTTEMVGERLDSVGA